MTQKQLAENLKETLQHYFENYFLIGMQPELKEGNFYDFSVRSKIVDDKEVYFANPCLTLSDKQKATVE